MRVQHPLRVARRAARVTKYRRLALIELRVVEASGTCVLEQILVAQRVGKLPDLCPVRAPASHDDVVGDSPEARSELGEDRNERLVHEDHPVLGVVDDVGQLLGEQADVQRVQHGADAGGGEVELEVALVVPGEARHPVALLHAEPDESPRQPVDPVGQLGVGRPPDRALAGERHQLGAEVAGAHPAANVIEGQLKVVLHQTLEHLRHPP